MFDINACSGPTSASRWLISAQQIYLTTAALIAVAFTPRANAEGCYNGGNTNAEECSQFYDDFCTAAVYGSATTPSLDPPTLLRTSIALWLMFGLATGARQLEDCTHRMGISTNSTQTMAGAVRNQILTQHPDTHS
ncbi:hypothetical protein DFH08DRAFT_819790 [Mycena albidolilacea]|uniref:Uncharacterized protein n=1 Tax=Mycena albidolilacea TaxID=1033008 RepID=A0AAD6ZDS3_9AGAR|nr:hypothetical protein DFH08DRAFT_819790 [Mycena albidolilacea]